MPIHLISRSGSAFTLGSFYFTSDVADYLQKETGSALVYLAFFLVLYREGMPGVVLFSGVCAVVYFVVGIRFDQVFIADTPTPIGEFAVLLMILYLPVPWFGCIGKSGNLYGI